MRRSSAPLGRLEAPPLAIVVPVFVVVVSLLMPFALWSGRAGADPVSDSRAKAARLAGELSALNLRSSSLAEAYDRARLHLDDVNARLAATRAKLQDTGGALTVAQRRVRDLAILSYMRGGAAQQLSLLIPSSANEIGLRSTYAKAVTGDTNDAVDALHAAKTELGRLQSDLASAQAAANKAVGQLEADRRAAEAADAQIAAAYGRAQSELGQALLKQARDEEAAANQARIAASQARRAHMVQVASALPPPPPGVGASTAIAWARAELGKPYEYGGGGPDSFDCSGLTAWAWGHAGHPLPHSSESQYYETTHVTVDQLEPGDLVFYGMPPHHVGLYVGGGEMINALHSGTDVEYDSIYVDSSLIGGGRVN